MTPPTDPRLPAADPAAAPAPAPAPASDKPRSRWRRLGLLGLGVAAITAVGAAAVSQRPAFAHGAGFGHRSWQGAMDPAAMSRRIDSMAGWMLADIDATPQQKERVATILKAAANDLQPLRESHRQARRESLQLFAAAELDRAKLEKIRLEQMQLGETVSRRLLQAMMDAAEVLAPDQRAKLVATWQRRMDRRG